MSYSPPTNPQPITGSQGTNANASWNSSTSVNAVLAVATNNYNTVTLAISPTSTMTNGVLTFEVSPDSTNGTNGTWFPISLARIDSYTTELTYTLNTVTNRAWSTSVDAVWSYFRVRLSTVITGTGTLTLFMAPQAFAIEPIVTVGQLTAANLQTTSTISGTPPVYATGRNTGGATAYKLISAASTNSTLISTGAHTLYAVNISNNSGSVTYVKLYNKATAPTIGTDVPVKTMLIPANGNINVDLPPQGEAYSLGLGLGMSSGMADTDTGNVAAAQIAFNCTYV